MKDLRKLLEVLESGTGISVGSFYDPMYTEEEEYELVTEFGYFEEGGHRSYAELTFYEDEGTKGLFEKCPICHHNPVTLGQGLRKSLIQKLRQKLNLQ